MKRIFYLLFVACLLVGCSSDDDDTDDALFIERSELFPYPNPYLTNIFYDNDKNISISYYWSETKSGTPTFACEGTCPLDHEGKKEIYITAELKDDKKTYKNPSFCCSGCKSIFNINNGKCTEGKAKGYSLRTYKAKSIYDGSMFIGVYIWK